MPTWGAYTNSTPRVSNMQNDVSMSHPSLPVKPKTLSGRLKELFSTTLMSFAFVRAHSATVPSIFSAFPQANLIENFEL